MTPLSSTSAGYHGEVTRDQNMIEPSNVRTQTTLRTASYIKVADLAKSYNINFDKMKLEIERIHQSRSAADVVVGGATEPIDGKDDSHSMISKVTDDSASSGEKKLREAVASKGYPKRFSAMNGGFNLCLLVGNVDVVVDKLRVDKSRVRLAEVQVGDETGIISLRARDEQIDALQKVSDEGGAIVLRNSSIELFQGKFLRLAVTKWGKISVYPDAIPSTPEAPATMNTDMNLSIVDLTRVPADLWLQTVSSSPPNESASLQSNKSISKNVNQQQSQQYHKKGRVHDRRNVPQPAYYPHLNKIPPRQDYSYNQMMGITQSMAPNVPSYGYHGTQYYSTYDDASFHSMHSMHQKQHIPQQKQSMTQQQYLFMQQQHFQMRQQVEEIGRFLSQTSTDLIGDVNDADRRPHMSTDLSEPHQSHLETHDISDNRSISWSVTGDNMIMEVPMSPQMNPHAASFAPNYPMPDLGTGTRQGQQQYYMQPQQGPDYSNYNAPAYYPTTYSYEHRRNDPRASNEEQPGKGV